MTDAWRPIETAPSDLTEVLVWDGADRWIAAQNEYGDWSAKLAYATELGGFYLQSAKEACLTHWMPLPEPPNPNFANA